MIASGSTTFFFDFDIFSMPPVVSGSPVAACTQLPAFEHRLGRQDPFAVRGAEGLVDHHALREQAGERLLERQMAGAASWRGRRSANREDAGSHARRRRYTDRPASSSAPRARSTGMLGMGRAEAREVPGGIDEGVERVGLALGRAAACAGRRHASRSDDGSSGLPGLSKVTSSGSVTGRSSLGTGTTPQSRAVDHRDRAAPIALARNAPVAQAVVHLALADAHRFHARARPPPWPRRRSCRRGNRN